MFDNYAKKLQELNANVPKIFEHTAKLGAKEFIKVAKKRTDEKGLVDTGAYRRNWFAQATEITDGAWAINCVNSMEYASHLEYGHKLRNGGFWHGKFVGRLSIGDTEYYCLKQLDNELDKAYKKRAYGE